MDLRPVCSTNTVPDKSTACLTVPAPLNVTSPRVLTDAGFFIGWDFKCSLFVQIFDILFTDHLIDLNSALGCLQHPNDRIRWGLR
jgi:hypothetical protein